MLQFSWLLEPLFTQFSFWDYSIKIFDKLVLIQYWILFWLMRNISKQLHHMSYMILIFAVTCSSMRFKQEVSSGQLKCHTSSWPDVSSRSISSSYDDLKRPVLSSLDVICVVMVVPAGITKIRYLHLQIRTLIIDWVLKAEGFQKLNGAFSRSWTGQIFFWLFCMKMVKYH